ncbi:hypothetical protein Tco_0994286 [Tanacetum coccineum]
MFVAECQHALVVLSLCETHHPVIYLSLELLNLIGTILDGSLRKMFLQFRKTTRGRISPIAPRKVENSGNRNHADYVLSATNPILDELLKELGYKLLDNTVDDKEGDCNPTRDIEELERLLAKYHQSFFTEIKVPSWIVKTNEELEPFIHIQQLSPLYGVFKSSKSLTKPCKVGKEMRFPFKYNLNSSFPYPVKFDGNYPRWFFKDNVSTVWKDDRRSDKSYSCERSGKVGKSTSVFGYELLDNTVLDKEGDRNLTRDIEEIERILAKYNQSFFTEIKVPSWILKTNEELEPFIHIQ